MSLFPDAAGLAQSPYTWQPRFKTHVAGPFANENIVTRAGLQFALHSATIRYYVAAWDPVVRAVMEFFNDQHGRHGSFAFYDLNGWDHTPAGIAWGTYATPSRGPVYVATQTVGGTTTFDLPARYADQATLNADSTKHVLVNGSNVSVSTWSADTGVDGRTRVVLGSAPALGDVLSCTFTARRVWNAKFTQDYIDLEWIEGDYYSLGVQLIEVP